MQQRETYITMLQQKVKRGVLSKAPAEIALEEWMNHTATFTTVKESGKYSPVSALSQLTPPP